MPRKGTVSKKWRPIIDKAREIVNASEHGMTLRGLYYALAGLQLPDFDTSTKETAHAAYKGLGTRTTRLRRAGTFPALLDLERERHNVGHFEGVKPSLEALYDSYGLDRTEGQEYHVLIAGEKKEMLPDLRAWFQGYGVDVFAIHGFSSETFEREIREHCELDDDRPSVLIYGGDFDPSGECILKDFVRWADCFEIVEHVGLTCEQVREYKLPFNPEAGEKNDKRNARFKRKYGKVYQYEIDALNAINPGELKRLYMEAFQKYWVKTEYDDVLRQENRDKTRLRTFIDTFAE